MISESVRQFYRKENIDLSELVKMIYRSVIFKSVADSVSGERLLVGALSPVNHK